MAHLKSLNFTALTSSGGDPVLARRAKLIARLEDQIALAKDPNYAPTDQRRVKGEDGSKTLVAVPRNVRPWWRIDVAGATVFTVRYGFRPIEFEKGKAGIAVPSKEKLISVIQTMIAAVRAGELDALLTPQAKARSAPKTKSAA
jgi:hypothetical protein